MTAATGKAASNALPFLSFLPISISRFDGSWEASAVLRFVLLIALAFATLAPAHAADEPDLIFKRSTVFKWLSPNDKLATYGLDDPAVEGVACHFTAPEKGGWKGWAGLAEEVSDISLACRQIGPIKFKAKFDQGDDVFRHVRKENVRGEARGHLRRVELREAKRRLAQLAVLLLRV